MVKSDREPTQNRTKVKKKRCEIDGCTKYPRPGCRKMCTRCFQDTTGEAGPKRNRITCRIDGCTKFPRPGCRKMCTRCFQDTPEEKRIRNEAAEKTKKEIAARKRNEAAEKTKKEIAARKVERKKS